MAETEKILYDVRAEGADETARGFKKIRDELQRLFDVMKWQGKEGFVANLAESINWLEPALKKADAAGISFGRTLDSVAVGVKKNTDVARLHADVVKRAERGLAKYRDTVKEAGKRVEKKTHHISEYNEVMKKARETTEETEQVTKKTGRAFGWGAGKLAKFAGAVGLGIYSMYSLASAVRRGFRAVVDFVRGGIDLALKKHKEWATVIDRNLNKKLETLKLKLGEQVLPTLVTVSGEIGKLLDTLKETGVIRDFGNAFIIMAQGVAGAARLASKAVKVFGEMGPAVPETVKGKKATPEMRRLIKGAAKEAGITVTEEDIKALVAAGIEGELRYLPPAEGKKELTPVLAPERLTKLLPTAREQYKAAERVRAATPKDYKEKRIQEIMAWAGVGKAEAEAQYEREMIEKSHAKVPKAKKEKKYYGPFGETPGLYELETYTKGRETEFARETEEWKREKSAREKRTEEILETTAAGMMVPRTQAQKKKEIEEYIGEINTAGMEKAAKAARVAVAYTEMVTRGIVNAAMADDTRSAFAQLGKTIAASIIADLAVGAARGLLRQIPGIGQFLQAEGLVKTPTLAWIAEREPEFVITQERMRGLLRGGHPRHSFGPEDFGAPNINVAPAPAPDVHVNIMPGVDAEVQTAYRARAGEARLAQLEG